MDAARRVFWCRLTPQGRPCFSPQLLRDVAAMHHSIEARFRAADRRDDLGRPEPFPGVFGLRRFLGVFLSAHLDLPPGPRRTTLDLLIG